jgi:hypothetical protein
MLMFVYRHGVEKEEEEGKGNCDCCDWFGLVWFGWVIGRQLF